MDGYIGGWVIFSKALYYPYIHIPDNLWLRKAILYWDQINPIVPGDLERQIPHNHISKELQEYGMLKFINPESILDYGVGMAMSDDFLAIVSSKDFLTKIGRPEKRNYSYKIHEDKFAYGLLERLREKQLFKNTGSNWLLVENNTGIIYMGFLASYLAKHLNLEPLTDTKEFGIAFLSSQLLPSERTEVFVSLVIEDLMPTPKEVIPVKKLIAFKQKNERELLAFRRLLQDTMTRLKNCEDESQFITELSQVKDNFEEQILALQAKLKENKIQTVLDSLEVTEKSMPEVNVRIERDKPSIEIKDVLSLIKIPLKIVREVLKGHLRKDSMLESNPYTYILKAKREFG